MRYQNTLLLSSVDEFSRGRDVSFKGELILPLNESFNTEYNCTWKKAQKL